MRDNKHEPWCDSPLCGGCGEARRKRESLEQMETTRPWPNNTYPPRETPSDYSLGVEKGITFAARVLRRALEGGPNAMLANPELEALRKDLIELRKKTQQLIGRAATLLYAKTLKSVENGPEGIEVWNTVPEHRLKDTVYMGSYEVGSGSPIYVDQQTGKRMDVI